MTIVVAHRDKKNKIIYLGADSQGSAGYDKTFRSDRKIFKVHGIGYGFTSSYRMGQILQYHSEEVLSNLKTIDPHAYVVKCLIPMWRRILSENGYTHIFNNEETGGNFIICLGDSIFNIEDDFQVGVHAEEYVAIGCGCSYAYGSMYETDKIKSLSIETKVKRAVEAACYFSAGCGGKAEILALPY